MQLDKKTMELLLVNYHNINNSMLKPCADKTKFINLIADLEIQIKKAGRTVVYSDGLSALEFANKLAKAFPDIVAMKNANSGVKKPVRGHRAVLKLWIYACYMIDYPRQMNKFAGVV